MTENISRWRAIADFLTGRDPRANSDATITTKYGHRIIPYKVTYERSGAISTNIAQFLFQPRVRELERQMGPLNGTRDGDRIALNTTTGQFYLDSDIKRLGDQAAPLGQIDLKLEEKLFDAAARNVVMNKMFRGMSYKDPIIVDESGCVYPKNNPKELRGHISRGPEVHISSDNQPKPPNQPSGFITGLLTGLFLGSR